MELTEYDNLKADYARQYLEHINDVKKDIDLYELQIGEFSAAIDNLKGIDYSKDRVSGTGNPDKLTDDVIKLMEMCEYFAESKEQLEAEKAHCLELLRQLDEAGFKHESYILCNCYLFNKPQKAVERDLAYCRSSVATMKKRGLVELYNIGLPLEFTIPMQQAI